MNAQDHIEAAAGILFIASILFLAMSL